jgi:hypothetical protein
MEMSGNLPPGPLQGNRCPSMGPKTSLCVLEKTKIFRSRRNNNQCAMSASHRKYTNYRRSGLFRARGFQEAEATRFQDNRHIKVVRMSALRTSRLSPQEIFPVLISVRSWVDRRAIVRLEGLCQWKIKMTPSGIEPATSRLTEHCATICPHRTHKSLTNIVWLDSWTRLLTA